MEWKGGGGDTESEGMEGRGEGMEVVEGKGKN